jgi:hypothetical protein
MCSFNDGKPWPEVDYSLVRACLRELEHEFDAHHILNRLYKRKGLSAFLF